MKKYICNPVNINYGTQASTNGRTGFGFSAQPPHRGTGDPTIVWFKDRYYLVGSFSGFYHSPDLVDWQYETGEGLQVMPGAAADLCQVGEWLYQTASSREKSTIHRTKDPMSRQFEQVSEIFGAWDPCLFLDDDGRLYMYHGCTNTDPIWGIEMDPKTMTPIGEQVALMAENTKEHGWERNGWNNDEAIGMLRAGETWAPGLDDPSPWIEGPYVNKHNGKYYLQYAATGTELPVYADGCYVADKPLGPYTYCPNSPFSAKTGGFYNAAGHGSSFQDEYGNWWHASSMVGTTPQTSRKTGLFPLGFDKDGIMYCDMNYADYPHVMPDGAADPNDLFTGWMLLSYKKPVTASSTIEGRPTSFLTDEDCRTYWAASRRAPGEWVTLDLEKPMDVRAVQLYFVDHDLPALFGIPNLRFSLLPPEEQLCRHRWLLEGSVDGQKWETLCDKREADTNMPHDLLVFEEGRQVRYLRLTSLEMPFFGNFAMCGFRVFGHGGGAAPGAATGLATKRDAKDPCTFTLEWNAAQGADGYNVRWGIAPDKLYHSSMVYGGTSLLAHSLNAGVDYWVQVDAFNGSGITEGECLPLK